ncbi:MAG: APC family permease [Synergistaceae bacterium]|nr:APC family permease [Synergistaceae bacterium]
MLFFNFDLDEAHLNRRLTPLNVWSLAFGCVIGWSAFVMPGNLFLRSAGPLGTLIAMQIAAFVMLIISYSYSYMIKKFPLTGGEFIYAERSFGVHHGFICAWFLSLSYLSVIPLNATALNLILRALFGDVFRFGLHYNVAGYEVYTGEILVAVSALTIFAFIDSLGVQFTGQLQTLFVMILLGGILIVIAGAVFSPEATTENMQPMFRNETAFFTKGIIAQIIAVYVTGPQSFVGFDTVPQLMEESDFSPESTKIVMDTSILCGAFVYIALTFLAASVVPAGYVNWVHYIDSLGELSGVEAIPTLNAAKTVMGTAGLCFISASVLTAMFTGIIGFYTATSRLLYAMSREKMLPSWFSELSKNSVPVNAGIFCAVVSGITCLFGRAVMGWVFDMASIGASIGFAYTSISACKYALKEKRVDIIIFGALGFILSLSMGVLLLVPIPGLNVSLSKESYILLVIWTLMGLVFYFNNKRGNKYKS